MASIRDNSGQWVKQSPRRLGSTSGLASLTMSPWEETLSPAGLCFPHLGINREEYQPHQVSCLSPAPRLYSGM